MVDKAEITGGMGTPPPPDAPRETTQPLTDQAIAAQVAAAQANERELKPLVFNTSQPPPPAPPKTLIQSAVSAVDALTSGAARRIRQVSRRPAVDVPGAEAIVLTDADAPPAEPVPVPTSVDLSAGAVDPPLPHQRAASDSDSPSRGVPSASTDPGKQVTGGFGAADAAQYFPLDGSELRELVYALLDQIHARLADDLRFSMAICYPRVSARVEVHIEGYPVDVNFVVPAVMPPHVKTPLEIAKQYGDDVVFVVRAERVEMTADGESVAPPNQTRSDLGLNIPRKQAVDTPTGRMLVDVTQ